MKKRHRSRAHVAWILVSLVIVIVVDAWVMAGETRHPAPSVAPALEQDSLPPSETEARPFEVETGAMFTR